MALNESQILSIETAINVLQTSGNPLVQGLRSQFPGITFIRCDAADMDTTPFRSSDKYQLYLINRKDVCITVTDQLDAADGVIVAVVS
jgi:hypothetical protein